jgi:hypothetical protein
MVGLAVEVGACDRAAAFRGACQTLRELTGVLATPSEAAESEGYCARCRAALGDSTFAAREAVGRALPIESAIAMGLEWLESVVRAQPAPSVEIPQKTNEPKEARI